LKTLFLFLTLILSGSAIASEIEVYDGTSPPYYGCWAKSPRNNDRFYKTANTKEDSKNSARNACNIHYRDCQVTHCQEVYSFKITCHAAKRGYTEFVLGGFRAESNDYDAAATRVLTQCRERHGEGPCVWLCYPNKTIIPISVN